MPIWGDAVVFIAGFILITAIAVIDVFLAGPVSIVFFHAAVVLLGLLPTHSRVAIGLAIVATLASVFSVMIHPPGPDMAVTALGSLVAIWIIAGLVIQIRKLSRPAAITGNDDATPETEDDIFYRAVFDQTYQFVSLLDAEGSIDEVNETFRDFAGLTEKETKGSSLWVLPVFGHKTEAAAKIKAGVETAARGDFFRDEFRIAGAGDVETIIDLSLKPIRDKRGAVSKIIMEARDITDARNQQEILHRSSKSAAIGELTAGVSHDFNNILTAIVGNLELLQDTVKRDEKAVERLRRATDAAFRGRSLTQQLLAFARRQSLNPSVIDVNQRLEAMNEIYQTLGEGVEISFDLDPDIPNCEVDPSLLENALLNLALNARDAMQDGGEIEITTRRAEFDETYEGVVHDLPPGDYICIAVSDTGTGMDEETAERAFDPFFTTKGTGEGTGLGLSMVYGFVKQSEGDVKIYSEKDKGTTIRIYLPGTDKKLNEPDEIVDTLTSEEPTSDKLADRRALVVDDDDDVREVMVQTMTEAGCVVDFAESGEAAIAKIDAGEEYDLVLTDMVMTGDAGGAEVANAARAAQPDVPVIFCSGFPKGSLSGAEAATPGALFLAKPFMRAELLSLVERVLSRHEKTESE